MACCSNFPFCKCQRSSWAGGECARPTTKPPCGCSSQTNCAGLEARIACLESKVIVLEQRDNQLASRILDMGLTIEFQVSEEGIFQWRYVGDVSWTDIAPVNELLAVTVDSGMATINISGTLYSWPVLSL